MMKLPSWLTIPIAKLTIMFGRKKTKVEVSAGGIPLKNFLKKKV